MKVTMRDIWIDWREKNVIGKKEGGGVALTYFDDDEQKGR